MVRVSPLHQIELADAYRQLVEVPRETDYVLRTLALKTIHDDQPLIQADLVIAGKATRQTFPLADQFPVHFLKTYYPGSFHTDPRQEFDNTLAASKILGSPAPIGYTRNTFRCCFIPGRTLEKVSPFHAEPAEANIAIARETPPSALVGLWKMLEEIHSQVQLLHENGLSHGDMQTCNVIVCLSPIRTFLIDFAAAPVAPESADGRWKERKRSDLLETWRQAIYIQCALGRQQGLLGEASLKALPTLFRHPDNFSSVIREMGVSPA